MSSQALSYRGHLRETISLSVPVIIGQLGTVLMGVIDNVMIGGLGAVQFSAATLSNSLFFLFSIIPIGATYAITPLISESVGAGKAQRAGKYLKQSVYFMLLLSGLIMAVLYGVILSLPYFGQPEIELPYATSYLMLITISTPFMILALTYKQFCDGLSNTMPGMVITVGGLFANIFLNWVLIFGNLGFPRLELFGAGLATLLSRVLMFLASAIYVHGSARYKTYLQGANWNFLPYMQFKLLKLSIPVGMQFFFEVAAFAGATIMIGWLSEGASVARAAHQAALSSASVTFMVVTGWAAGSSIRIGNYYGAKDYRSLRMAGITALVAGVAIELLFALLFIVFNRQIPMLYTTEADVLSIAAVLMLYGAAFQVFDGVQAISAALLRGMQDVRVSMIVTFVSYWLISLPLSYYLCFNMDLGVVGIWISFIISLAIVSVFLTWRFMVISAKLVVDS